MSKTISRGEIWSVNFDPQVGAEIQKKRPAVVISMNYVNLLPLHIVVPITTAQTRYKNIFWMVAISKDSTNGLNADSFADASQIKSLSTYRFDSKIGVLDTNLLNEILVAIVLCIGYNPPSS
ncbi:MAG: type II toxin-antitoxin system PemK/MazF family toxin [Anaerolineae bacterium]|jgi:mRNA interferase MazF|nr:type II toxin-antitoxin system PemK/MazF family toxin [Anaerolineae bacterium]